MILMLRDKLNLVPELPGCYLMHDKKGTIIYVGKAKKLKRRLSSYFNREHTGKTKKLVSEIVDFEYIVTNSETEALVLELNLIKKYDPKYNILLRDDKTYPYIELTNEKYPRLLVVRNINKKKNKHKRIYGPYPNVYAARKTVNLLNRIYPLRKCVNMPKDVCLYYHIHECLGYCKKSISTETVDKIVNEIIYFLNGNYDKVINKIKEEMETASEALNFEKAKELKELIDYINITLIKQKVDLHDNVDRDIFGYYVNNGYISFQVFFLRGGKLVERDSHIHPIVGEINEELEEFISRFYEKDNLKPKEILVPNILEGSIEILKSVLEINVLVPKKGEKKKLLDMAIQNAKISLEKKFQLIEKDEQRTVLANEELGNILNIENLNRVEIFDNSNIFGNFNVSGMVVFENGKPNKNEYRKFSISEQKNDDFNTMKEVIYRRYFRLLKERKTMPDLIIVDGGKNQITATKEVINDLNINIPICGLVKNNKHRTSDLMDNNYNIVNIDRNSNVFHLLTRMQDEVHKYTINYHRQIRSKGSLESILDSVEGIGNVRKKQLLKKYGSLKKIKELSVEQLNEILPLEVAKNLCSLLKTLN
ncbi:MAG: excinuclease ABC subunit UvrC [Firmicutes bacterium]|nr:excinuclease ABC subunit UvrC [Bacillota bacterium]